MDSSVMASLPPFCIQRRPGRCSPFLPNGYTRPRPRGFPLGVTRGLPLTA
jgi:hypothetical protein